LSDVEQPEKVQVLEKHVFSKIRNLKCLNWC